MIQYEVFKPDRRWSEYTADLIARMSKIERSQIKHVEINCGSGSVLGWVVLQNGERISV